MDKSSQELFKRLKSRRERKGGGPVSNMPEEKSNISDAVESWLELDKGESNSDDLWEFQRKKTSPKMVIVTTSSQIDDQKTSPTEESDDVIPSITKGTLHFQKSDALSVDLEGSSNRLSLFERTTPPKLLSSRMDPTARQLFVTPPTKARLSFDSLLSVPDVITPPKKEEGNENGEEESTDIIGPFTKS